MQQHRRARFRRQAGDAGQQRIRLRRIDMAQRRRGQQQPPVLLRPLRQRPLPGVTGEHPRDRGQCLLAAAGVTGLGGGEQARAPIEAAQEGGNGSR